MKYFTFFPKFQYKFLSAGVVPMMDIFNRPDIKINEIQEIDFELNKYVIEDGESPDSVARNFYGSPEGFWYILSTNNIMDIYKEWPVSYNLWRQSLTEINGNYTLFTPYNMDIQTGDIIAKYTGSTIPFDRNNFGVVVQTDPIIRSFDVDFIKGKINELENFMVLRKTNNGYTIIKTPNDYDYQQLKRIQTKLDSIVSFLGFDEYSEQQIPMSPYKIYGTNQTISAKIDDVTGTNCILDTFLNYSLSSKVVALSFLKSNENEFISNKNISIVSARYLPTITNLYLEALSS